MRRSDRDGAGGNPRKDLMRLANNREPEPGGRCEGR
jgi:hypothetical protein